MKIAIILPSLAKKGPIVYCKYLVENKIRTKGHTNNNDY